MRHRPIRLLAAMALASVLTLSAGCLYRMDIRQGNVLNPTQVIQLENGMTKTQVKFLLGTPMIPSGFDADRWNYYYYEKTRFSKKPGTRRLTVWFKDDKVERFERPADTEAAAAAMEQANAQAAAQAAAKAADADVARPPRIKTAPTGPATPPTPRTR